MNGYDSLFELDYSGNTINPAVAAGDGNIVILAENDDAANQDIICFYGTSLDTMSSTVVLNTGDNEMYPDVRHLSGQHFVMTYVKNNNLYAMESTNGGQTWTDIGQINTNTDCVVEEYKTSDLCEAGAKAMWEEDCDLDIDIWIGDVLPNDPPGAPSIDGPATGDAGTVLTYTFNAVDPDDDDVRFYINWGDGNSDTTDFTASGNDRTASHTWASPADYTITAYAEDSSGNSGSSTTFTVTIPRNKAVNTHPFIQFLQNHPNMFPLLRQLLGL
jgi:hypothetical protein